jgi:hypothetical protein
MAAPPARRGRLDPVGPDLQPNSLQGFPGLLVEAYMRDPVVARGDDEGASGRDFDLFPTA